MKRGSIIVEATIVITMILLIVMTAVKELSVINHLVNEYFNQQTSEFETIFNESVEVIRIEKSIQDGR
jgi:hypothetical protein